MIYLPSLCFFVACALSGVGIILAGRAADRSAERAAQAQAVDYVDPAEATDSSFVGLFFGGLVLAGLFIGCLVLGLGFGSAQ